ncbi:MAG TPA: DUF433 domain-containing protein [Rhizomicrobium sp.]|jgi:uncharacterized protein (DUF433 family)|nr:DUF433 domain-containing protein [Rhizomicrobium sp.]
MTVDRSGVDDASAVKAFGFHHVMHLTGLSKGQLSYWDGTGFFAPTYAYEDRRSPYSRVYSFKDVVGLRVLSILRSRENVPLARLRKTAQELERYSKTPWADLKLYVFKREVYFDEPETGQTRGVLNKQYIVLPLISVIDDVRVHSIALTQRDKAEIGSLERHRYVAHNSWVVAGTRIPINAIRRYSEAGFTPAQIVKEYPVLTKKDVVAALAQSN